MKLTVNGKEYTVEYTFEAAHNKKCVDVCWNQFTGAGMMKKAAIGELENPETANKAMTIDNLINFMSDIPDVVITLLYAGLLENHEDEIQTGRDARKLYKQFCKENPDDPRSMDFGMFEEIKAQMEEDGFFKRIGLEDFMKQAGEMDGKNLKVKEPQDHKGKANISHSGK